jgi:4-diphosphocytidyl-2-C-methyl-D-erythritol kinase
MSDPRWPAPAKLNLFLHVTGRRADGYHNLQTLFQIIDLNDEIEISVRLDGAIVRSDGPAAVAPLEDLTVRAAKALRQAAGRPELGADLRLFKRIPIGGGLGGGSSDAATVLVALNELWGLRWETDRLLRVGVELGADVPVFVQGTNALATGVGELLEPVDLPPMAFAVIFPGCPVSTVTAFQAPELTRNSPAITIVGSVLAGLGRGALPGRNDLQAVILSRYPPVREALAWLSRHGDARMSGSGACVFAAFADVSSAEAALVGLPKAWTGFAVKGLSHSPLIERLALARAVRVADGA